ncbi:MAG: L,D-transpeptidase [Xanthobacteraceae bacterium]|nr:L,D-transpeptidase [Xanthobacteraceae bacterium]
MSGKISLALLAGVSCLCFADQVQAFDALPANEPTVLYVRDPAPPAPVRMASAERGQMGGGFIEFLFGDAPQGGRSQQQPMYQQQPDNGYGRRSLLPPIDPQQSLIRPQQQEEAAEPAQRFDPKYEKQVVEYHGKEGAGTIVVDTPNKFLFLVQGDGKALRYGIGVGRPGFTWSGVKTISAKKEWPAWTPPPEMLARRPDLPRHMEGGPQNPLGARAMYLGSSLYRIHGSNEPWTIGTNVSSGCIRMRNEDVIDLYGRVGVGARVIVI